MVARNSEGKRLFIYLMDTDLNVMWIVDECSWDTIIMTPLEARGDTTNQNTIVKSVCNN